MKGDPVGLIRSLAQGVARGLWRLGSAGFAKGPQATRHVMRRSLSEPAKKVDSAIAQK
jgi:hypothetical protein